MASTGPLPSWLMVVAAVAGLPFTWGIAYALYHDNKQHKKWVGAEGRITRSGLAEVMRSGYKKYMLDISYAYSVNGRRYESKSVSDMEMYYASKSEAQSKADRYPAGAAVTAFVNPDKPEEALLEWGHAWWSIALAFFLGVVWEGAWLGAWYATYLGPYLRRRG